MVGDKSPHRKRIVEPHQPGDDIRGTGMPAEGPEQMLAGNSFSTIFTVKFEQQVIMLDQQPRLFVGWERLDLATAGKGVGECARMPRPAAGGPADHHRVGTAQAHCLSRIGSSLDVTIDDKWQ